MLILGWSAPIGATATAKQGYESVLKFQLNITVLRECECYNGFEGMACQRNSCPNDCNGRGQCLPMALLAAMAGRNYTEPWDAYKIHGCFCDLGYRGPDCSLQVIEFMPIFYY